MDLIAAKGYKVGTVDATICAERPKLKARIPEMQLVLAILNYDGALAANGIFSVGAGVWCG